MGRKKLEMKLIEDNSARMVCFSKRRNGLIKKAKELSILCDVDVAAIIFSKRGKLFQYCSSDSISQVLQQYQSEVEKGKGVGETQDQSPKDEDSLTIGELLQTIERELDESRVDELSVTDLVLMEKQLETAIMQIRSTKNQSMLDNLSSLQEKEKMLADEKKRLEELAECNNKMKKKKVMIDLNIVPSG